ncbi:hypothetical protein RF11_08145 [Thelohanellus kitauei]|uniref:Uncharacterized protein n=1 Tax=Thelohanellus kitauei TaxID=669202 RepID=A0A0C2MM30_THEKT|nr:hypothetical protein RF11_08145 [Thelohanellus kitauei]
MTSEIIIGGSKDHGFLVLKNVTKILMGRIPLEKFDYFISSDGMLKHLFQSSEIIFQMDPQFGVINDLPTEESEETNTHYESVNNNGVNTQNIERICGKLKDVIMRRKHGTSKEDTESHLYEFMWRSIHQNGMHELFLSFIDETARQHPIIF